MIFCTINCVLFCLSSLKINRDGHLTRENNPSFDEKKSLFFLIENPFAYTLMFFMIYHKWVSAFLKNYTNT